MTAKDGADPPADGSRFYGELASWWPLISPVDEYAEEAAVAADLLASAVIPVREVLELGSGGGSNASYLSRRFAMTLTDLSPDMLAVSQLLNPEAVHVQGDMRSLRLGRAFDAVFVHDAIDYMTTLRDLRRAVDTAFVHCRPGGVALFMPDQVSEIFEESTDHGGVDGPDGRAARYLQWSYDPDPSDSTVRTEYVFALREADGVVRSVHESHITGLFSRTTWLEVLSDSGFAPEAVIEPTQENRTPRILFLGHRPP